jgi:hypothetical protein
LFLLKATILTENHTHCYEQAHNFFPESRGDLEKPPSIKYATVSKKKIKYVARPPLSYEFILIMRLSLLGFSETALKRLASLKAHYQPARPSAPNRGLLPEMPLIACVGLSQGRNSAATRSAAFATASLVASAVHGYNRDAVVPVPGGRGADSCLKVVVRTHTLADGGARSGPVVGGAPWQSDESGSTCVP